MNKIEALELELKARKMVEGTGLDWWNVVRHKNTKENLTYQLSTYLTSRIELALGIVEGKPVWNGDLIWCVGYAMPQEANTLWLKPNVLCECSWNPPKPKTVMVELGVKLAENLCCGSTNELAKACRKALEGLQ